MQTNNKLEEHIANTLKNRELTPSDSAWERLSNKLDGQEEKKKRKKYFYFGYAASILILISVFFFNKKELENTNTLIENDVVVSITEEVDYNEKEITKEMIVVNEKKEVVIKQSIKEENTHKLLAKKDSEEQQIKKKVKKILSNQNKTKERENTQGIAIYNNAVDTIIKEENKKLRIQVNPDDLLYAVTHSQEEVKAYYAKYNVNRNNILDSINVRLKKSNLKIDPEFILAEVENTIEEADFQQNFMEKFKSKISDVIVAIAERNN